MRLAAAQALFGEPDESRLPLIEKALAAETSSAVKAQLALVQAASLLGSQDAAKRLAAAKALGENKHPDTKLLLNQRLADESDPQVQAAIRQHRRHRRRGWSGASGWARCSAGHQPGLDPAAGGAGPRHHLRADGRHQPWRLAS